MRHQHVRVRIDHIDFNWKRDWEVLIRRGRLRVNEYDSGPHAFQHGPGSKSKLFLTH